MIFGNYKLIVRTGIIIGMFMFLIIILTALGIISLNIMQERLEDVVNKTDIKVVLVKQMRSSAQHQADIINNLLFSREPSKKEKELQHLAKAKKKYEKTEWQLIKMMRDDNEKAIIKNIVNSENATYALWDKTIQLRIADKPMPALVKEATPVFSEWLDNLDTIVRLEKKKAKSKVKNAFTTYSRTRKMFIIVSVFSVIVGVYFVLSFTSSITTPLFDFMQEIEKIAQGDLTVKINYDKQDEMGILAQRINHMVRMLNEKEEELKKYHMHLEKLVIKRTETINRQRESFISVLIHDLKGPLTPILGFTKRLIDGKVKSQEETLESLKTIQASSQELLRTIEYTSKALKEKLALQSFHEEEVNLKDILLLVHENVLPEIENKGIEIFTNKTRDGWNDLCNVILKGDPYQLKTLIENLLGNAIKYANSNIEVKLYKFDSAIHIAISDDGPGIPEKYHKKIFEEYFQVPGSKKGTGLGLYSVKKVVDNHNGKIVLNSSMNKGVTFEVVLPC